MSLPLGGEASKLLLNRACRKKRYSCLSAKDGVTFLWEVPSGERLQREPRIENRASDGICGDGWRNGGKNSREMDGMKG